jgi:DNA repair protein RadC
MHEGHRERVRNRYLQGGIDSFSPHEIIELILFYSNPRGDTNKVAHRLIEKFGSVANVFDADISELTTVKGVGGQTAVLLKLIPDLYNYYHKSKWEEHPVLATPETAGLYAVDMIGESTTEGFYIISLDSARKVIAFSKIAEGTVADVQINQRLVLEAAVRSRAESVILVHNHPTGRLFPSNSDRELTFSLAKAFDAINITLLDHIIVGGNGYYSFISEGILK